MLDEEMPNSYPEKLQGWYALYCKQRQQKLGHDALLYLAEDGINILSNMALSIIYEDSPDKLEAFSSVLRPRMSFGQRVELFRRCLDSVQLIDLGLAQESLGACGRLKSVVKALPELHDSVSVKPLEIACKRKGEQLTLLKGWDLLVQYRNKTLGHPDPMEIGSSGFYPLVTPLLAGAVAELLWQPAVREAMERLRFARLKTVLPPSQYEVSYRGLAGHEKDAIIEGDHVQGLALGTELMIQFRADSPNPTFRARPFDLDRWLRSAETSVTVKPIDLVLQSEPDASRTDDRVSLRHELVAVKSGTIEIAPEIDVYGLKGEKLTSLTVERSFAIGRYPVTQELYDDVLIEPGTSLGVDVPVVSVPWLDCVRFCIALSDVEGLTSPYRFTESGLIDQVDFACNGYRLPTEREWVFACLGGITGIGYPCPPLVDCAWFKPEAKGARPVGEKLENGLGLKDMLGNVHELCSDFYQPGRGSRRVACGGCWNNISVDVHPGARVARYPTRPNKFTGFRIARTLG